MIKKQFLGNRKDASAVLKSQMVLISNTSLGYLVPLVRRREQEPTHETIREGIR